MRLIDADALKARIMVDVPGFLEGGSSVTKAFILAMLQTRSATPTIDAVPIVRCVDCKHRPKEPNWETFVDGSDLEFPEGSKCPCKCSDNEFYSWYPADDWFCRNGERRDGDD